MDLFFRNESFFKRWDQKHVPYFMAHPDSTPHINLHQHGNSKKGRLGRLALASLYDASQSYIARISGDSQVGENYCRQISKI